MDFNECEKSIGYSFKNKLLLTEAFTHTSYAYENKVRSNERLEYLGDSILEFVISEYLFLNYTNLSEGEMTKVRANVVCEDSLFEIAKRHNFSDFLYLGKSEKTGDTKNKKAILADSVEAVIAAIYLDSNIEEVKKFIINNLENAIRIASKNVGIKDYKTVLQEKLQVKGNVNIRYKIINEYGPDHNKTFVAQVECDGKNLGQGEGKSKKNAEMIAAKQALDVLFGK